MAAKCASSSCSDVLFIGCCVCFNFGICRLLSIELFVVGCWMYDLFCDFKMRRHSPNNWFKKHDYGRVEIEAFSPSFSGASLRLLNDLRL